MKNISKLRHASEAHKVAPSDRAWLALENRLSSSKNRGEVNFYKSIAIAAIFLAVLGVIGIFHWQNIQTMESPSKVQYSLTFLDTEENAPQDIYEISKLWQLKAAYNKQGSKVKI